jgi:hypothetical protein
MGVSLLSPCNWILKAKLKYVYLNQNGFKCNRGLSHTPPGINNRANTVPTVNSGWPDYIKFVNASGQGAGGVVIGELSPCIPTVFWWQWLTDVANDIKTADNREGRITNSDLEMAGLVLLWLAMEEVCGPAKETRVTLFNDNSPKIGWATKLAVGRCT